MLVQLPEKQATTCTTRTHQDIHNLLAICQRFGLMGAVVGNTGTGKSTAVRDYAESNRHAVYCEVRKAAASMRSFLKQLITALGGYGEQSWGADDLYKEVLDQLYRVKQWGGLLILDEVQDLEPEAKDTIRNLYEDTRMGICLVGNRDLLVPSAKRGKVSANVQRFLGRIGPKLTLDKPMPEDLEAFCAFHGITGKESQKLVNKIATTGTQLHSLAHVLEVAKENIGQDGALTFEALRNAAMLAGALV